MGDDGRRWATMGDLTVIVRPDGHHAARRAKKKVAREKVGTTALPGFPIQHHAVPAGTGEAPRPGLQQANPELTNRPQQTTTKMQKGRANLIP